MNEAHERLKSRAYNAVETLVSDTSVTQEETLESLREIRDEIDMRIDALVEETGG